jgi:hypothetical protein
MLANSSYANYQIVSVLTENLVRTEEYASTQLGGISVNYDNVGGKQLVDTKLYSTLTEDNVDNGKLLLTTDSSVVITVLLILVAVSVGVFGLAVSVKRRYL